MSSYKIVYSDNMGCGDNYKTWPDNMGCGDYDQIKNLEEKVKKLLAQGWSCIGGVVVCKINLYADNDDIIRMYQTMVKVSV